MNDRFKFRVYSHEQKIMRYISDFGSGRDFYYGCFLDNRYFGKGCHTVMQCTGLKDRNGKYIYEGDIVKDTEDKLDAIYKIGFKKGAFFLDNDDVIVYFHKLRKCFSESRLKIIGNIYTTPELLEEKE